MTRYEKVSTLVSVFALIAAIASPFISYRWLDPQIQSFKNRAKLQVSGGPAPIPIAFPPQHGTINSSNGTFTLTIKVPGEYRITILNAGQLPAKDVLVTAQYDEILPETSNLKIEPPLPTEVSLKGKTQYITLTRPIAPQDKVEITFPTMPTTTWVSNEFGETSTLFRPPIYVWNWKESNWIGTTGQAYKVEQAQPTPQQQKKR